MKTKKTILFGSGFMAEEYLKVLSALKAEIILIGRNKEKAALLAAKYGAQSFGGGISALGNIDIKNINLAIIATSIESLRDVACACINSGIRNILIEKPGALTLSELNEIRSKSKDKIRLAIAYNRRFYNSVLLLKDKIKEDGGALGCFFDFTDREKDILDGKRNSEVLKKWGWANSSHVIDTAFYLIGEPQSISCIRSGGFNCHPAGSVFSGSGKSKNCLFSYFATWSGGGRWNIEISTVQGRYKLSPLEELSFCRKNQFSWEKLEFNDTDDVLFKPGLYKMVKSVLLKNDFSNLSDIEEQIRFCKVVNKIFGYKD